MGQLVVNMASTACNFGLSPSVLAVLPDKGTVCANMPVANIMDFKPFVNIVPFGMCSSLANPAVATATSAALGTLTPMPCTPVTTPWKPGSPTVVVGNMPALDSNSTCQCAYGGVITVTAPGQLTATVP